MNRREQRQAYDRRRYTESETRRLYGLKRWRDIRDDQLAREPFCRMCRARGEFVEATVCDHVEAHNGDVEKFWSGPFQSLCLPDHNSVKQAEEAAARRLAAQRGARTGRASRP